MFPYKIVIQNLKTKKKRVVEVDALSLHEAFQIVKKRLRTEENQWCITGGKKVESL